MKNLFSDSFSKELFQNSLSGILILDHTGKILTSNPSITRLLGYTPSDLQDSSVSAILSDKSGLSQFLHPTHQAIDISLILKDQSRHIFPIEIIPFHSLDQKLLLVMISNLDAETLDRLQETQAQFQQIFNTNQAVKLVIDPEDGRILLANKAACAFYGYDQATLTSMKITQINTLSPQEVKQEMDKAKSENRLHFNFQHRLASGEIRDVEVYSGPIFYQHRTVLFSIIHDVSERRSSEVRWQFALEGSDLGIFDWYPQENKIFFSQRWKTMLGYSEDEIQNDFQEWDKRLHPYDRERTYHDVELHLSGKTEFYKNEHRLLCKDGSYKWIQARGKIMSYTPEGKPERMIGTHMDITERKQAEYYLDSFLENREESIWTIDRNYCFVLFNQYFAQAYFSAYGVKLEKGLNALSILSPYLRDFWEPKYTKGLQGERQTFFFSETLEGVLRHFQIILNPILIDDEIIGASVISVDVSQRIENEESLRKCQEQLRTFASHFNGVAFIINKEGIFQLSEGKGLSGLGLKPGQVVGISVYDVYKDYPEILNQIRRTLAGEMVNSILDMGPIIFDINYQPLYDDKGCISGLLGLANDITEKVKAEKALRQSQEDLRQAEKMQAIGQLAGGVAHDFNNQLAGIMGFAEILKMELADNPDLYSLAENIILGAQRSSDLTSQLLAFARKGKYTSESIDMHELIVEVVTILEHTIDKKIKLATDFQAQHSLIQGDPSQLQNAIMNLALNARDAMPQGGQMKFVTHNHKILPTECAALPFNVTPGDFISITISDTGTGITEEVQKKMFEPFFTTKDQGKGTGMGLAAVYGTVKNHDGIIRVKSTLGTGTDITILLPLAPSQTKPKKTGKKTENERKYIGRILFIDDEPLVQASCKSMLEKLGYYATVFGNGKDAVQFYQKNWKNIDLVLLDMVMPELDGHQVFNQMKKINPKVKVILSSGFSLEGEAHEILKKGVKRFIHKPFRMTELAQVIEAVLTELQ